MASTSGYLKRLRAAGVKVKDACKEHNFTITKQDIKNAKPGHSKHCVIANKLKKEIGVQEVHVFTKVAHVLRYDPQSKTYKSFRHSIDPKTRDAIRKFDEGQEFPTGNYTLRVLERHERKSNKKKRDLRRPPRKRGVVGGLKSPKVRVHIRRYEDNFIS